jgi:lipoprotein signal peptidase
MGCGCDTRKTIMFADEVKPGKAEVYILAIAVGTLVIVAMPKLPLSDRMQGVVYGTIVGGALGRAVDAMLDKATNNVETAVN